MATNLAPNTVLVTGGTGQTAPGLTVVSNVKAGGYTFVSSDFLSAPTFFISDGPTFIQGGAVTAANSLTGSVMCPLIGGAFFPTEHPGAWGFPDGPINQGMHLRSGTGAPSGTNCGPSSEGDLYVRRDGTPISLSGSGVLYQCQFAGNPGTYAAVA